MWNKALWFNPPAWFKRFLLYLRYRKIGKRVRSASNQKPTRALCEELLLALRPELFTPYNAAAALALRVSMPCTSIDAYTQKLKDAAMLVRQGKPIDPLWAVQEDVQLSVDRFLVSEDGYYVNAEKEIAAFKVAALRLCVLMQRSDSEGAGLFEHNLRVLTKLFISIRGFTAALIEISLAN